MIKTVKIPQNIALKVCNNARLKKGLSIYMVLKALDENGQGGLHYNFFIQKASDILKVHERTIRNWLIHAIDNGIIKYTRRSDRNNYEGFYKLLSWIELSRKYECESNRFNYIKVSQINFKFEYVIDQLALKEKQEQCKKAALAKYNYSLVMDELKCVVQELGITTSLTDLKKCQHYDYLTAGLHIHENQRFFINAANPDINLGYKKLSSIYGYNSKGGMAYKKRVMVKYGLISVTKRQYLVEPDYAFRMKTNSQRETKLGSTAYFRPVKTIALTLCDEITTQPQTAWKSALPVCSEKI